MNRILIAGMFLALIGCQPRQVADSMPEDLATKVDALVQPFVDTQWLIGISIGVIHDGRSYVRHYGETSLGSGSPPTDQTLYEIGSITKTFTGTLAALAEQRGELSLSDTLDKHLPDAYAAPEFEGKSITLRQIATHTSAIPRMPNNLNATDPLNPYANYTPELMYQFIDGVKLMRAPGAKYEYSNIAMALLGQIVAERAGADYESVLRDRMLKPLGMNDSRIRMEEKDMRLLAQGHNADTRQVPMWDLPVFEPSGAIRSNIRDMLRYAQANLRPEDSPLGKAIEQAQQPLYKGDDGIGVGLAWHIARDGNTRFHTGMTGGYNAAIYVNRTEDCAVVVLTNTATDRAGQLAELLFRRVLGVEEPLPELPGIAAVSEEPLQRLVGTYLTPGFPPMRFDITREGGALFAQLVGQPAFRIYPMSETEYYYRVVDAKISFTIDEQGKSESLTLHQNGRDIIARRIEPATESPAKEDSP